MSDTITMVSPRCSVNPTTYVSKRRQKIKDARSVFNPEWFAEYNRRMAYVDAMRRGELAYYLEEIERNNAAINNQAEHIANLLQG